MTAIYSPGVLYAIEDQWPATCSDERRTGLSQHRFFCECGNVITAPSASAYIEPGGVRHHWACDACHQTFETSIRPVEETDQRAPGPIGGTV